jgi:hypothetical protein
MEIAKVCLADLNLDFEKSYTYNLPEFGQETIQLPEASTNYISQPDFTKSCTQTFSYRLTGQSDDGANPAELTINPSTGVFTLTNDATIKTTYSVEIDILTTDGTNDIELTVPGITIQIICGPESTTLTPPTLDALIKASVETNELTIVDAEFATSNSLCPVASYELTSAAAANNDFIEQPFFMTPSLPTFTVSLDPAKLTLEDVYSYTVTATAEGGSSATVSQSMEVYDACVNTLV